MLGNGPYVLGNGPYVSDNGLQVLYTVVNGNGPHVLGNGPHLFRYYVTFGIMLHSVLCGIRGYVLRH